MVHVRAAPIPSGVSLDCLDCGEAAQFSSESRSAVLASCSAFLSGHRCRAGPPEGRALPSCSFLHGEAPRTAVTRSRDARPAPPARPAEGMAAPGI